MMDSEDPAEKEAAGNVQIHFPGQGPEGKGVHVNISGAGLLKHAPNPEGGKKLLEFMASEEGQKLFVKPSWEYAANESVDVTYPMFPTTFRADQVPASELAANNKKALMIFDQVGWR
jgi:iron(III) transport system substrate-binding protein